jgi:hypothetical protein
MSASSRTQFAAQHVTGVAVNLSPVLDRAAATFDSSTT